MIEMALVEGTKIRWQKPPNPGQRPDGTIVPSVNAAGNMMYLGSTQQQPRRGLFRRRAPQVRQMPVNSLIPYTWLDYISGRTSYITQATDVLTGFMSGCLIARGIYNGSMTVFHMGTIENPTVNNLLKTTFRGQLPQNATGFYPHAAWSRQEQVAFGVTTGVVALVTSAGSFYSICLHNKGSNNYTVLGIKKVPPIPRATLLIRLT